MYFILAIIYILLCIPVAIVGSGARLGFLGTFILSILLTPLLMIFLLIVLTPKRRPKKQPAKTQA